MIKDKQTLTDMNQTEFESELKELIENIHRRLDRMDEALGLPKWDEEEIIQTLNS